MMKRKNWTILILLFSLSSIHLKSWAKEKKKRKKTPLTRTANSQTSKKFLSEKYRDLEVERLCGAICRKRIYRMNREEINSLLKFLHSKYDYFWRLRILSSMLLGAPYKYGPLGEGPKGKYDRDPIFRLDRFDCVTFIETVIALALSKSLPQAVRELQKIRYRGGKISYQTRNHFTVGQWLPVNSSAGYLRLISEQIGGPEVAFIEREFSKEFWLSTRWGKLIPPNYLPKKIKFPYIPLSKVKNVAKKLPFIGWMGEVRSGNGPVIIAHVGFFLKKNGKPYF